MDRVLSFFKKPIFWIVTIVLILVTGIGVAAVYQYQKVTGELAKLKDVPSGGTLTDERQRELIAEVAAKIVLPADEKPTVAVVSDINRLKDQQFFSQGQNGDVVLIYMNSRKAILYRPAEKKIIEVAPVNLSANQDASGSAQVAGTSTATTTITPTGTKVTITPTPQTPVVNGTFALRNGTTITGLARTFETQLTTKFPGAIVNERGNAAKRDYSTTTIVDVKGTRAADVQTIAQSLGISAGTLPAGETTSTADFLIIIGSDKR